MKIERLLPDQWQRYRKIRLSGLADAPDAFGSTLAAETRLNPADWQQRLSDRSATFVAMAQGGDIGVVSGAPWQGRAGVAGLFGMWTAPEARGRGIGAALVRSVIDWARDTGFDRLVLDVADQNVAGIALYRGAGFRSTGATGALPPPRDHITEHERELRL
ncbi:GNAT family N-acetyltransferase [uncultured Roseovarius sp.]|uniref:GNAT family N-acetyltransferase n=1 Tax=uncultured Roseovarius sp. TaxID=293344 RepID=UPI00261A0D85|nr:GNAT family N-acetyltransferase [uncultured Roseovarius sp.]